MYGVIEYNEDGKPMCEICGKHFNRVIAHARQKHDITEKEYKLRFGFDLKKGICSKESSAKSREKVMENYDKCIGQNLIKNGEKSRFQDGDPGRTKDKVSQQTKLRLIARLKEPEMVEAMRKSGKRLAATGLGNKKRWNND